MGITLADIIKTIKILEEQLTYFCQTRNVTEARRQELVDLLAELEKAVTKAAT